jgi:meso-butanediol dehydrogenase / (S,S)-butanediol dehydrogenase / diacetyl reductase
MFDFTGKRVLVTGGARGIGAATAAAFQARGARVAIGARSAASFDAFVGKHGTEGYVPALGDVGDRAGACAVVAAAIAALGGLDILINSAGIFVEHRIEDVTEADWTEMMRINLGGTFFCSQAALPALEASGGNIVNLASDAGLIGFPLGVVYCATKGGVVNMTRAMAIELACRVRVNCVCPGYVDSEMVHKAAVASGDAERYLATAKNTLPMKRMATLEEVAAAILYFASDEASFTTGAALPIDGGGTAA